MSVVQDIITLIGTLLCLGGAGCLAFGALRLVHRNSCQEVEGTILDYNQEYSTRGFIRKMKVTYTYNGREYTYTTSGRTFQRHAGGPIMLRLNKKGKVVEVGQCVELICVGALMILIAIIVLLAL